MYETFTRILVTTDFSETGDRAIGHAFRMAADHGAEVLLCHVLEAIVTPNPLYAHYYLSTMFDPKMREQAETSAREALLQRVPPGDLARVAHRTLVVHGQPVEEIDRNAREQQVDLIVISAHGHTGLRHLLLGSVVERVIRRAPCPVFIVR
ncbi:MAG: universal stress protein [Candidatus Binatia bacterium]